MQEDKWSSRNIPSMIYILQNMWLTFFLEGGWWKDGKKTGARCTVLKIKNACVEGHFWSMEVQTCSNMLPLCSMGCIQPASPRWLLFPTFFINFLFFFSHLFSFFISYLFSVLSTFLSTYLPHFFHSLLFFLVCGWLQVH